MEHKHTIHKIITGLLVATTSFLSYQALQSTQRVKTSVKPVSSPTESSKCVSVNGLPDISCTPGTINTSITQANIKDNICNPNWSTKSERPPSSYTTQLKIQQIKEYGFTDTNTASYEEDHLISLELGGNPTEPKNLWPEAYAGDNGAKRKDAVENILHKEICSGSITLQEAQSEISSNWENVQVSGNIGVSNSDN